METRSYGSAWYAYAYALLHFIDLLRVWSNGNRDKIFLALNLLKLRK